MARTAEQIFAADDLGLKRVSIKEWPAADGTPGELFIRVLSVGARDEYERMWIGKKETGIENFRSEYLARCLCDEKGVLVFSHDQVAKLAAKSGAVVSKLFDLALAHNNMTEADVEELGKS
jgi:hypothetical protein